MNGYEKVVRVLCRVGKADDNLANKVGECKVSKEGFTFSLSVLLMLLLLLLPLLFLLLLLL